MLVENLLFKPFKNFFRTDLFENILYNMLNFNHKVSVIIPIYNSERFFAESIESVLNQTYSNIQVLAVNDGSTENSLKILEKYKDKIKIII